MVRNEHWATHDFDSFLRARANTPFAWGVNDCSLFPADAIKSFTGVDMAADFRGKYSTEAEAFALIASVAGSTSSPETAVGDVAAWCAEKYGLVEWQAPLCAQRGDLVVIENAGRLIAGVVHLNGRHVVAMAESGIVRLRISDIRRSWHV